MNEKTLKTLEFDKILEQVCIFASANITKNVIKKIKPITNIEKIRASQKEVSEAVNMILKKGSLKIGGLRDIAPYLKRVEMSGSLNFEELLNVADFLTACKRAKEFSKIENKNDIYPMLKPKFDTIQELLEVDKEITRCIISDTQMSDFASKELNIIRNGIKKTQDSIRTELNKIVQSTAYKNMLQDAVITMRGDRHCIPVKSEYKNSFSGIVHDQSATGATFFIEPKSVVSLNNKIKELQLEENKEINRVLKKLSEMVNENKDILHSNLSTLIDIDFIFAKGEYSISINGVEPIFNEKKYINIKKARHPLLDKESVVPTDIYLGKDFSTLLITGPNTGGKTVILKTIGLFTVMGQAGLHIPAYDKSELSVFESIYSDIGDEQSIEQSLSTFSSHMTNIVWILKELTENSLVILDELGAGTDPTEGASLAIAIIKYLHSKNVITAITTHYSELKVFAITTEGISNASCEFDIKTLRPTYRLLIGVPGKSNAFAISKRIGLPENIIEEAKNFISKEELKFEDVITDLEINKKSLIIEKENAQKYRQEAEMLKKDVENQKRKIKEQKEKILFKATEEAKRIIAQAKIDSDNAVREVQRLAREKAKQETINEERQKIKDKLLEIDDKLDGFNSQKVKHIPPKSVKKGDRVYVHSLNQKGIVMSNPTSKGIFMVKAGIMNVKVSLKDVSMDTSSYDEKQMPKRHSFKNKKSMAISYEVDLRGLYVDEAIEKVDKFIDDAFLAGMEKISIIHGKGTGALRAGIHTYLRRNTRVSKYRLGEFGEGDAGVTIAELK